MIGGAWGGVSHDPEDYDAPRLLVDSTRRARVARPCAYGCPGGIQPGQQYTRTVCIDDAGVTVVNRHAHGADCADPEPPLPDLLDDYPF